jgi:hypothetical protein
MISVLYGCFHLSLQCILNALHTFIHSIILQSPGNGEKSSESGVINYQVNGTKKTIFFYSKDCDPKNFPRIGDKVSSNEDINIFALHMYY